MAQFKRTLLAEDGVARVETECLGNNTQQYFSRHVGALVKMTANSFIACAAGDDIGGQIVHMEGATINDGFSYGSVKKDRRIQVIVGADGDTNAVTVGATVVADVQPDLVTGGVGHVKVGTGVRHKWEVIAISGAGAAGDIALLQKV